VRRRRSRKSAFVPSVVFTTAVAGVIPVCAVACGSGGSVKQVQGVAMCAYSNCGVAAVAYMGFDSGEDSGDAGGDGAADAPADGATDSSSDAPRDGMLGVADAGFGSG